MGNNTKNVYPIAQPKVGGTGVTASDTASSGETAVNILIHNYYGK